MSAQREDVVRSDDAALAQPRPVPAPAVETPPATRPPAGTEVPVLNVANVLTLLRIAMVPLFVSVLFVDGGESTGWRIAAFVVFAAAAVTDRVDGQLARKYGLVTDFGKLADPIADKALIGAALVGLSVLGDLSWWVTVVIAVRELGITVLRFVVVRHRVIPAGRGGKLKTLVQALAIGCYLLPLPGPVHAAATVLMGLAVVLTVVTGIDYVVQAIRLRARRQPLHTALDEPGAAGHAAEH